MKKITVPLLFLLFFTTYVHSQTTLACQFIDSAGHTYEGGKWKRTGFLLEKPFFIKLNPNGVIDESSLKGVSMDFNPQCKRVYGNYMPELVICHDSVKALILNTKTMEGARSFLGGIAPPNPTKDDMSISLFNCQVM